MAKKLELLTLTNSKGHLLESIISENRQNKLEKMEKINTPPNTNINLFERKNQTQSPVALRTKQPESELLFTEGSVDAFFIHSPKWDISWMPSELIGTTI